MKNIIEYLNLIKDQELFPKLHHEEYDIEIYYTEFIDYKILPTKYPFLRILVYKYRQNIYETKIKYTYLNKPKFQDKFMKILTKYGFTLDEFITAVEEAGLRKL